MKTGFKKALGIILIVIALGIAAWYTWRPAKQANSPAGSSLSSSISISIDSGRGSRTEINDLTVPADATVFSVTRDAAEKNGLGFESKSYPGMGTLITRIGDRKNGENGAYWQFWLNGKYAEKAADQMNVAAGDKIDWKFSSSTAQ